MRKSDFMDDEVLKSDINLGVPETEVEALVKGSPSHESDSGCSDMFEEGSVSPIRSDGSLSPGLFDLDVFTNHDIDEFESELESYLVQKPVNSQSVQEPVCSSTHVSPPAAGCQTDDCDPDYIPPRRIIQSVAIQSKSKFQPKENASSSLKREEILRVVPGKARVMSEQNSNVHTPAIKVVKVIKAPTASTSLDIEGQLHEALDERNRKNAVQAKINREKKKQYINSLEEEIDSLKAANSALQEKNENIMAEKDSLLEEVSYLKNVLANESALASLLKNIPGEGKVRLSSSFKRKRGAAHDHDYGSVGKRLKPAMSGGVCLHVDKDEVSLEFCSKCATMAKS